jgi:hypothetical protein
VTHQEVCFDPYTTHSARRGMCPLRIETIPGNHWHFTLFIPFQTICYFIHILNLLHLAHFTTYTINLHFPPSTINFPYLYLKLYLFYPYCLVEYFLSLSHVCNLKTFILQWKRKNWHQMSHQTLWNQWLNTHQFQAY